jgi:predicted nucleic acid-binding protein
MSYLVDTNVLLRLVQKTSPLHAAARKSVLTLRKQGEELCVIPQNLIEFWAVATRPAVDNGLGLTTDQAVWELRKLKRFFMLQPDTLTIFSEWEKLVITYQVSGKQAHDTRLVAAMSAHKIAHILTFNTADFKRFSGITAVDPANVK